MAAHLVAGVGGNGIVGQVCRVVRVVPDAASVQPQLVGVDSDAVGVNVSNLYPVREEHDGAIGSPIIGLPGRTTTTGSLNIILTFMFSSFR